MPRQDHSEIRFGIVTPSYNQGEFLEKCIRSVTEQGYGDVAYVVMDGGSTDGSCETIRRLQAGIEMWRSRPDGGQGAAINEGLRIAGGDLLTFVNSDDYLLPGVLQVVAGEAARHPEVDVFYGDHLRVDEQGRVLSHVYHAPWNNWVAWRTRPYIAQPGTFFRRALWDRAGGIDESLHCCFDTDLWYRFMELGAVFRRIPQPLAAFRVQPNSKGLSPAWRERYEAEQAVIEARYRRRLTRTGRLAGSSLHKIMQLLMGNYQRRLLSAAICRMAQR